MCFYFSVIGAFVIIGVVKPPFISLSPCQHEKIMNQSEFLTLPLCSLDVVLSIHPFYPENFIDNTLT